VPIARNGLIAAGVVTTGQFAASTFVTPFLLQTANLHTGAATVLLLGYGLAGIVGTLLGSGPVARTPVVGQTDGL
jgi:predicted MFS family arabinose efflux permease